MGRHQDKEELQELVPTGGEKDENPEENTQSGYKDKIKGVVLVILVSLVMGASATFVALLDRKIPDFELNAMRCGFSCLVFPVALVITKQWPIVPRAEVCGVLADILVEFSLVVTIYVSVSLVPMTYYKSLHFTTNLLSGLLLFPIVLKEKLDWKKVLFVVVCIIGVILSIQPEFIFTRKRHNVEDFQSLNSTSPDKSEWSQLDKNTILGCSLSVASGIFNCLYLVVAKKIPFINENALVVSFWSVLFGTVMSLVVMVIFEKPVLPETWTQFIFISAHCMTNVLILPLILSSMRYISGNTYIIVYSSLVVVMLIPQYTVLSHILPGNRNWIEVLGTVLVFAGCTAASILEVKNS